MNANLLPDFDRLGYDSWDAAGGLTFPAKPANWSLAEVINLWFCTEEDNPLRATMRGKIRIEAETDRNSYFCASAPNQGSRCLINSRVVVSTGTAWPMIRCL